MVFLVLLSQDMFGSLLWQSLWESGWIHLLALTVQKEACVCTCVFERNHRFIQQIWSARGSALADGVHYGVPLEQAEHAHNAVKVITEPVDEQRMRESGGGAADESTS